MNPVIKVNSVEKEYKHFHLGPIDFEVEKGTVVAVVGANGSGKSTLFKTLMGLAQPDNGYVQLFGLEEQKQVVDVKNRIGFAGSGLYHAFSQLTVNKLAEFVSHWYTTLEKDYYEHLLNRYEINGKEKFANCSLGTQKKVEFVLAMAHRPQLLLLDEPSANVDMLSQRRMREDLKSFMEQEENSIVISTYIQDEVKQMCDYICILDDGKIKGFFEKDEIRHLWARLWISSLPDQLKNDPRIWKVEEHPLQVITNQLPDIEEELLKCQVDIIRIKRLELDDIMEYMFIFNKKTTNTSGVLLKGDDCNHKNKVKQN
ncbi:ATP-binding cassette domain-containing protein [Gracilibacillus kekensis]|uniref:ABC-2 type transport system ATP-binding protein n=1 Tax=Gracilibacillus kekensis TaxID=1027249 RepID=A0A1M7QHH3_9BACI|nr:ABC transporter ATP-binding protein [Gracilibacillus kekensis]SHN30520.1 ABC-2 type transport system ATP-binding protein [Gracilibacillus kekensis]